MPKKLPVWFNARFCKNSRQKKQKLRTRLINTPKPNEKLQGDAVLFLANVTCHGFAKIAIR